MSPVVFRLATVSVIAGTAVVGFLGGIELAGIIVGVAALLMTVVVLASIRSGETVVEQRVSEEQPGRIPPGLVATSILAHWMAAVVLYITPAGMSFAPDQGLYKMWGELLVANWTSSIPIDLTSYSGYNEDSVYYYLNAIAHWVTEGDPTLPMAFLNGVLATTAAVLVAQIAENISGRRAGRVAFVMTAFWPSMVFYSSLNLRDALGWLLIVVVLRSALRLRHSFAIRDVVFLVVGLGALAAVRAYVMALLVVGILAALVLTRLRQLPYAITLFVVAVVVVQVFGERFGVSFSLLSTDSLEVMETHRRNLNFGGSSGTLFGDVSTIGGALTYLPSGVLFFLLAPFPWELRSLSQAVILPELLVWYVVVVASIQGAIRQLRTRIELATLLFSAAAVTVAYALVEGNAGTASRHRGQVALVIFVFASTEIARWLERSGVSRSVVLSRSAP